MTPSIRSDGAGSLVPRASLVAEARSWLGTPFQHQAQLKGVGCDCIGLVAGVARACGIPDAARWQVDARRASYGPLPQPVMLWSAVAEYLDATTFARASVGDVLLLTFQREPMHFALVSSLNEWGRPGTMIHGYQVVGRVVEHSIDAKWTRRVVGAFRLRGVA